MYVSKMAGLIVLSTLCCSGPLVSQTAGGTRASSPTATRNDHSLIKRGTVNILLANKNGLVAITDSKLVMGNDPAGYAQKLFRIDDHTLCTIAGWYSWSGGRAGVSTQAGCWICNNTLAYGNPVGLERENWLCGPSWTHFVREARRGPGFTITVPFMPLFSCTTQT